MILALLSKESAFCLPLLVAVILARNRWTRRATAITAFVTVLTALVFVYRRWVLGTIGGYGAASGHPDILQFSPMRTFEALAFRMWGSLTVPLNWSRSPNPFFWAAALLAVGALLAIVICRTSADRRLLWICLAMTVAAALPAQHLLLLASDLNGARVEYLPSVGFVLFWGAAIGGLPTMRIRWLAGVAVITFYGVTLEHNLIVWRDVADLGRQACRNFASVLLTDGASEEPVSVLDLPAKKDGVYFLSNSFPVCVLMNSGLKHPPEIVEHGKRVYRWDDRTNRFKSVR